MVFFTLHMSHKQWAIRMAVPVRLHLTLHKSRLILRVMWGRGGTPCNFQLESPIALASDQACYYVPLHHSAATLSLPDGISVEGLGYIYIYIYHPMGPPPFSRQLLLPPSPAVNSVWVAAPQMYITH